MREAADGSVLRVRWWSFAADEVPRDREELADWLYGRWQAIDGWIRQSRDPVPAGLAEERPPRHLDAA